MICSGASPIAASPSSRAFSVAGVLGPQSNNVMGSAMNTYTFAGPTAYGVGTTMRSKGKPLRYPGMASKQSIDWPLTSLDPDVRPLRRALAAAVPLAARPDGMGGRT